MSSAELEQAILVLCDPRQTNDVKAAAQNFFEQLKVSPDGWKVFTQRLFETASTTVSIVCLGAILDVLQHRFVFFGRIEFGHRKPKIAPTSIA
jgi:hypothetical protein